MLTKTKFALAAAMFIGTTSFAAAQGFDPNMANRYPAYAEPVASAQHAAVHPTTNRSRSLQSAPVSLYQGRNVALSNGQTSNRSARDWYAVESSDRASSPYAGGGF